MITLKKIYTLLEAVHNNIVATFNEKEDIHLELENLKKEIASVRKPLEDFLANFSVIEDIELEERISKTLKNEEGNEITVIGKTIDSEPTYSTFSDIDPEVLLKQPKITIKNG